MAYIKVQKNRAYFKRFQVQFRRRREGKTDYQARKALIIQDKNKYATPRYRLVVRISNKDVVCQFTNAELNKDRVVCAAYAHELPRYGLSVGLTNYASCYATGLLLGRRLLNKLSAGVTENPLNKLYKGLEKATGEEYHVDDEGERRAFKAYLDIGLARASTGANVFAAMKGCVDAGINVPHSMKRFPGFDAKEGFKPEDLNNRIHAGHVAEYMKTLKADDEEAYNRQFSRYIKAGIKPENLASLYDSVFDKIRAHPDKQASTYKKYDVKRQQKLTLAQRKSKLQDKKQALLQKLLAK